MSKEKKEQETNLIVTREVKNTTTPTATQEYVAWCTFTTFKDGKSVTIKKGEKLTARDVPQVWIDQSVAQRWLITKEDKEKLDTKELIVRGYV